MLRSEGEECPSCYRIIYIHELEAMLTKLGVPLPSFKLRWNEWLGKWEKDELS